MYLDAGLEPSFTIWVPCYGNSAGQLEIPNLLSLGIMET